MTEHAPLPGGPRFIAFRYDRSSEGVWDGGYRIESQEQYKQLVEGRKPYDEKLTKALQQQFAPDVARVTIIYGLGRWPEPGPMLKARLREGQNIRFQYSL